MTIQVKEQRDVSARAGTHALSLLAAPFNSLMLEALVDGPKSLADLRRATGSPPQTTMRGHLQSLAETGIVEKRRQNDFPGAIQYALAASGRELSGVAEAVRTWLALSPEGPIAPGSVAAKSAIMALVEGWSTRMVRALAARPLSLTELDRIIADVSYPSLERRLSALRLAGQVTRMPGHGRGTPYAVTDWLRKAIAPLAAGACWERRHLGRMAAPITNRDTEAAFLLTLPLVVLREELSGICRLAVEFRDRNGSRLAGVLVEVAGGRVVSCVSRLEGDTAAWASGSAGDWLRAVIDQDIARLEMGGASPLAAALVDGLHAVLFRNAAGSIEINKFM